jgi:hypothetical protein
LGVILGALGGAMYGAFRGDVSLGLDGAVFGAALATAGGAVFGGIVGMRGEPHFTRAKVTPHVDR